MTDIQRFLDKTQVMTSGCWNRTINLRPDGYTRFHSNGKRVYAHRWIFKYFNGYLDPNLTIDHLCRNHSCVNPTHLESVTRGENVRRGDNFRRNRTHCVHGHEYTKSNTIQYSDYRRCKTCLRIQGRMK